MDWNTKQDWSGFLDVSVIWFRVEVNAFQTGESSVKAGAYAPGQGQRGPIADCVP